VFGILKNLDPTIWLRRFLGEAIKGKDFSKHSFENLSFEFWKKYTPPINREKKEGISEIDVTIIYKDGVIFIESKYLAPISPRTTHDADRNQIIRYLDLASYHHLNYPGGVREFFLILITDTEESPWILTHYRCSKNLLDELTGPGIFGIRKDIFEILTRGIGWISWNQLKDLLKKAKEEFQAQAERRFLDDLIRYLTYKIGEAERIRNERKQMILF
jgi:hypothetical protein